MEQESDAQQETTISVEILPPRFRQAQLLGKGGMGIVFRALDREMDRDVAVKLLSFDGVLDEKIHERFFHEAKTLTLLNHENIVRIFETGITASGYPYHVLEYLDGQSLSEELKIGALSPENFNEIFSQICSGLKHAHSHNVIHRDLKPSNIFIIRDADQKSLTTKIIDFGIATIAEDVAEEMETAGIESDTKSATRTLTRTNKLLGSPAYMSPEQCMGLTASPLSDIYALGCLMYECLTGHTPFEVTSAMDIMYKHIHVEAPKLAKTARTERAKKLAAMIDSCLSKNPKDRPQNIESIEAILNASFETNLEFAELKTDKRNKKPMSALNIISLCIGVVVLFVGAGIVIKSLNKDRIEVSYKNNLSKEQASDLQNFETNRRRLISELRIEKGDSRQKKLRQLVQASEMSAALLAKSSAKDEAMNILDEAKALCEKENTDKSKLLLASIYSTLGDLTSMQPVEAEKNFAQAVNLIRGVTGSEDSIEEEIVRRSLFKFHLSERKWVKARADFRVLRSIWDKNPENETEANSEPRIEKTKAFMRLLSSDVMIQDPIERIQEVELCVDLSDYAMDNGNSDVAIPTLTQCLILTRGLQHNEQYYSVCAQIHNLLARGYKIQGDAEAAKEHLAIAKELEAHLSSGK